MILLFLLGQLIFPDGTVQTTASNTFAIDTFQGLHPDWKGADGAISLRLDHRVLWLFGDTLTSRDPIKMPYRNSFAIQTNEVDFKFVEWGRAEGSWLWPRTAFFENDLLYIVFGRFEKHGTGLLAFRRIGTDTYSISNWRDPFEDWVKEIRTDLPDITNSVMFRGWRYFFSNVPHEFMGHNVTLARARSLHSEWEDLGVVFYGANAFGLRRSDKWYAYYMVGTIGNKIMKRSSTDLISWSEPEEVYEIPVNEGDLTYSVRWHDWLGKITYNINGNLHTDNYYPRFMKP